MEIPGGVRTLMWEYDDSSMAPGEALPDAFVERVMSRGGWTEMCWLLATQDRSRLRTYLERRGRRVLPPRELAFWALA